jgi:hypothetical protein
MTSTKIRSSTNNTIGRLTLTLVFYALQRAGCQDVPLEVNKSTLSSICGKVKAYIGDVFIAPMYPICKARMNSALKSAYNS